MYFGLHLTCAAATTAAAASAITAAAAAAERLQLGRVGILVEVVQKPHVRKVLEAFERRVDVKAGETLEIVFDMTPKADLSARYARPHPDALAKALYVRGALRTSRVSAGELGLGSGLLRAEKTTDSAEIGGLDLGVGWRGELLEVEALGLAWLGGADAHGADAAWLGPPALGRRVPRHGGGPQGQALDLGAGHPARELSEGPGAGHDLSDRAGHDDYRAAGASQGSADDNRYHWDATHCTSLGVLQDRDGPNRFNAGRADGERHMTGDAAGTSGQTQWGAFVTR
jgi:hypothetical protein